MTATNNDMVQIAYLSFATRGLKVSENEQIGMILDEAVAHNAAHEITGQLVYRGGIFLQLLEGEKIQIEFLLGKILLDHNRHENVKVLLKQPMRERAFPDWSMAYKKLDNAAFDLVNSIVPWQKLITSSSSSAKVPSSQILQVFKELSA